MSKRSNTQSSSDACEDASGYTFSNVDYKEEISFCSCGKMCDDKESLKLHYVKKHRGIYY